MYADVTLTEDTSTLYVRWEIQFDAMERKRLLRLGGPLVVMIAARKYVDVGGAFHETAEVEVPVYPHAGAVNRGQAKFRDHEARRHFVEDLQGAITVDCADFLFENDPATVPVDGHVIRVSRPVAPPAAPSPTAA